MEEEVRYDPPKSFHSQEIKHTPKRAPKGAPYKGIDEDEEAVKREAATEDECRRAADKRDTGLEDTAGTPDQQEIPDASQNPEKRIRERRKGEGVAASDGQPTAPNDDRRAGARAKTQPGPRTGWEGREPAKGAAHPGGICQKAQTGGHTNTHISG